MVYPELNKMFLRSGLDTTPEITRQIRERQNAERAIWRDEYLARQAAEKAAKKAASPGAKAHATMAAKKAKQLAAIEKRKATIAAKQNPASCVHAHLCTTSHDGTCCGCADKRPQDPNGYVAYNNTNLSDISRVPRNYYYCTGCKARMQNEEMEFGKKYYDGLREAYNVAGEEMHNFFDIFKSVGSDHENFMAYLRGEDPGIYIERIIQNYWS